MSQPPRSMIINALIRLSQENKPQTHLYLFSSLPPSFLPPLFLPSLPISLPFNSFNQVVLQEEKAQVRTFSPLAACFCLLLSNKVLGTF